jgi:hypothetical protein
MRPGLTEGANDKSTGRTSVKVTLALLMLVGSTGLALAQSDSQPNPNCKGGLDAAAARYAADAAGYAPATDLTQDKDCNWMGGSAAKGFYTIDKNGKVTTRQP